MEVERIIMLTDTAIILAGGKSKRMGFDKQEVLIDHKLAAVYIADLLSEVFSDVIIVSNKPHLYPDADYTILEDNIKDFGPLGGLYTGLIHGKSDFAYLIACDMPKVNLDYIRYMKELIEKDPHFDVLVTLFHDGMTEPFNAFYSKSNIKIIEELLAEDKPRIKELYDRVPTRFVSETEARRFSPDWSMFYNMNTKGDLEGFRR
jgi:molybdopterin-guanine dinucleotide biosynthesis protein A